MGFYFIIQYKGDGVLKVVNYATTGEVMKFFTRKEAKKYAVKNCLGVYKIFEFDFE